jgi:hypothetical protein
MKKISQIIFIFLMFILSFSQAFGEEYWQCEKIEGSGSLFFNDESSCDISSHHPYQRCKTDTCKKIDTEGSWVCTGLNAQTDIYFIGDEAGCKNFQEANPLKCNCAKEGAGVNIVPVDLLPNSTQEDRPNGYKLLAPIGSLDFVSYDPGKDNFVGNYLSIIFKLAIGIISALAVIMLIVAGIQYMGEDSIFGKTKAKNQMTNALLGLLIALGSFAILNTISPDLIGNKGLSIKKISIELDEEIYGAKTEGGAHKPDTKNGVEYYCGNENYIKGQDWGDKDAELKKEKELQEAGIKINHPVENERCEKIGQTNCTSLYQLNIAPLINFAKNCKNCDIVVTGGTECWLHSKKTTHRPTNSVVDLRITNTLTNFIEEGAEPLPTEAGDTIFTKEGGPKFLKESNHYHLMKWKL